MCSLAVEDLMPRSPARANLVRAPHTHRHTNQEREKEMYTHMDAWMGALRGTTGIEPKESYCRGKRDLLNSKETYYRGMHGCTTWDNRW